MAYFRRYILLLVGLFCVLFVRAQGVDSVESYERRIYFQEGYRYVDSTYRDNSSTLREIKSIISHAYARNTLVSIEIQGSASPTGSERLNKALSANRSNEIAGWIMRSCGIPEEMMNKTSVGVNWKGLAELIAASDVYYRDEAVDIINNTPVLVYDDKGNIISSRKKQLMDLDLGRAWNDMAERFFPDVRSASAVLINIVISPLPVIEQQSAANPQARAEILNPTGIAELEAAARPTAKPAPVADRGQEDSDGFIMGLKTNLLYDAALVPNIGAEFHLGRNFTVGGSWMYAWWSSNPNHYYWRIYGGDINFRKYFGRIASEKPMQGHHLGIYAQAVTYDFCLGGKGIMGGVPGGNIFDNLNYGVGVEYGYSLPIAKRLNMDFSIGLGYLGGQYREYKPMDDCYVWQATKLRHYWGPTKAEISLVWLLGRDNVNKGKGGRR